MNCKPGDLAIVIKSMAGNEGKIVRCLRLATAEELLTVRLLFGEHGPAWAIDRNLRSILDIPTPYAWDAWLRPIRPDSEPESTDTPRELEAA